MTSSSPTYDISYYIQFKIEFKDDILFNKTTTDNPRHVTLFVGVQYLTAESIKMHNKTSLFKINQSRVNPLRNIRLQKKKNIPHIAIIQRSPIRLKNQAHFNNYISIAHPRELIRNIDHSNRWSIFSLSPSFPRFATAFRFQQEWKLPLSALSPTMRGHRRHKEREKHEMARLTRLKEFNWFYHASKRESAQTSKRHCGRRSVEKNEMCSLPLPFPLSL